MGGFSSRFLFWSVWFVSRGLRLAVIAAPGVGEEPSCGGLREGALHLFFSSLEAVLRRLVLPAELLQGGSSLCAALLFDSS